MGKYSLKNTPRESMRLLAQQVRTLRKVKSLTQPRLAEKSGVALPTLKKFELTGKISLESFLKICDALGRLDAIETVMETTGSEDRNELFDI